VERGQVLALLGPSGCGKTTTLRIAAGLERPDSGAVFIGGRLIEGEGRHTPPEKRGVGLMFQDYALFPHLTVAKNVAFGLNMVARGERDARVAEELARVGLAHLADAYPHTLSGGEQQRVALARMLAPRPDVVLMDEPFSSLDTKQRDEMRAATLKRLKENGAAVVIVTHDPDEAMRLGDRIALMRDGRIVQEGTPVQIYRAPHDPQAAALFGGANVFHARVTRGLAASPFGTAAANGSPDGNWVEVIYRPSMIGIAEAGVPATVVSARPHDGHLEFEAAIDHAALAEGMEAPALIRANAPLSAGLAVGAAVKLAANPAEAFIFPCLDKACRG
jgi:iron(III) transport system ATP-binding protein